MACEYCKDGEYITDDNGIDVSIDEFGDGYHYLVSNVVVKLAGESKVFYTNSRIFHCPMCGEKLGGDA